MKTYRIIFSAVAALLVCTFSQAKVELPTIIDNNMVLQQQTDAPLWGKAKPGSKVTVITGWDNRKTTTVADRQTGKWSVRVKTPAAGGPYDIRISDGEEIVLSNVLVGEVWFFSGQSNMDMPMRGYNAMPARGATELIVSAKPSRPIHIYLSKHVSCFEEQDDVEGKWKPNTPEAVAEVSAIAYFFADCLQNVIDVPVGIIVSSWGGSTIETWIKRDIIDKEFPEISTAHIDGTVPVKNNHQDACLLWNGMISPLVPYAFKGMVWYQGEANRGRYEQYVRLQTRYVQMMREEFGNPDAPFYFVQIAPYNYNDPDNSLNGFFNEAQRRTLDTIPNSGMAVTCDLGEPENIHPCRKQEISQRLAYLALNKQYGLYAIQAESPLYKAAEFKDGRAVIEFDKTKGLSPIGADLVGFEIAGADKVFKPAEARVVNKKYTFVEVWSKEVPEPVAVRYCFKNWCVGGLYNNFGIPVAPFRTDNWDK